MATAIHFLFFSSFSSSELAGRIHGQKKWKEDFATANFVVWVAALVISTNLSSIFGVFFFFFFFLFAKENHVLILFP